LYALHHESRLGPYAETLSLTDLFASGIPVSFLLWEEDIYVIMANFRQSRHWLYRVGRDKSKPPPTGPEHSIRGQFESLCAPCHGVDGSGSAVTKLPGRQPRDFRNSIWQKSVTDERIFAVIRDGGQPHGLEATMPSWEGSLSKEEIGELVRYIRDFGSKDES